MSKALHIFNLMSCWRNCVHDSCSEWPVRLFYSATLASCNLVGGSLSSRCGFPNSCVHSLIANFIDFNHSCISNISDPKMWQTQMSVKNLLKSSHLSQETKKRNGLGPPSSRLDPEFVLHDVIPRYRDGLTCDHRVIHAMVKKVLSRWDFVWVVLSHWTMWSALRQNQVHACMPSTTTLNASTLAWSKSLRPSLSIGTQISLKSLNTF